MQRRKTIDELISLNKAARTATREQPPTSGIVGSAQRLSHAIDNITMQTLNQCAIRATEFNVKTIDLLNAVIERLKGTPHK